MFFQSLKHSRSNCGYVLFNAGLIDEKEWRFTMKKYLKKMAITMLAAVSVFSMGMTGISFSGYTAESAYAASVSGLKPLSSKKSSFTYKGYRYYVLEDSNYSCFLYKQKLKTGKRTCVWKIPSKFQKGEYTM